MSAIQSVSNFNQSLCVCMCVRARAHVCENVFVFMCVRVRVCVGACVWTWSSVKAQIPLAGSRHGLTGLCGKFQEMQQVESGEWAEHCRESVFSF